MSALDHKPIDCAANERVEPVDLGVVAVVGRDVVHA
jgi:hypothetical protein